MNYSEHNFLYERYLEGKHIEVWREINQIDQTQNVFCDDEIVYEINKVLDEMMTRVKKNIEQIIKSLKDFNYLFMDLEENGLVPKKEDSQFPVYTSNPNNLDHTLITSLDSLVSRYGYVPLAFKTFIRIVGSVNLIGEFPKDIRGENFPLLDPMVVFPIREIVDYHQYLIDTSGDIFRSSKGEYYIEFSYDEETKEGISGIGAGYGVKLCSKPCIDGILVNYEDNFGFIDYLRLCFKWGGFSNLQWFESDINPNLSSFIKELSSTLINI